MIRKITQKQIIRYLFVGGFSYMVEISVLYTLNQIAHLTAAISVAISFWVGFIVAYILQKIITFQNKDRTRRTIAKQLIGYSLLVLWNYIFTLVIVELFHNTFSVVLLRTIVIVVTTAWNYALYKILFKTATV